MKQLYPQSASLAQHRLRVDDIHELYIEEFGNPQGIPVVFIHGGPGSGCEAYHSRLFDPQAYRIVLFDQRGAGKSTPHASLQDNTTWHLVDDMEAIRRHLHIDKWVVFGGSWGSTLGLVYAQTHADRVLALIVRGIFMCRPKEIHWFYQEGASRLFPDFWEDYLGVIPENERDDLVSAYYRRLTGEDEQQRLQAALQWSVWEGRTATLLQRQSVIDHFADIHVALSLARIECHYFMNNAFLRENQILEDAHKLKPIPGVIVHGRYDVVCPIESAWELHKVWPEADLRIVADAGHAASEPGIIHELVSATDRFAKQLA